MKLTDRLLASGLTPSDLIHVVLVNDTSQDPNGSSYKTTIQQMVNFLSGSSNTFVTGFTYSNNTFTIKQNNGQPNLSVLLNNMTGLTSTTLSATTYYNLPQDVYLTGGTYTAGTTTFTNTTGGTFSVTGFNTGDTTLYWYAENSTPPTISPIATGVGSIALGNGAEALGDNMFVYGNNAGNGASGTTGSTFIGFQAGKTFTNNSIGANNIIIGTNVTLPSGTTNSLNIGGVLFGSNTYSSPSGNPTTGATATGKIGIGVVTPTESLDVVGAVKIGSSTYTNLTNNDVTPVPTGGAGTMVYDPVNNHFFGWNGSAWKQLDN